MPDVRSGPFVGVRAVELAGLGPAPFGAMILADLGADVIRIDRPESIPQEVPQEPSRELLGRNKRSIALNLKHPPHLKIAQGLIDRADVMIDPFRPGVLERLGLAPAACAERNPRLVAARMTGWGQEGPLAAAAGHDVNYIALAGALYPIGDPSLPPQIPLNLVGDFGGGGMLLALAIAAALFERERSGRGQVIDVAIVDGTATLLTSLFQLDAMRQWSHERGENWLDGAAPWYGVYRTADDRYVTVGALEEKFYVQLIAALGLDPGEWPQWERARWPALRAALDQVFARRTFAAWQAALEGTDVCFAPVLRPDEAPSHPHLASRRTYIERDGIVQPAPSPRFSRTPGALHTPPPWPGQHTDEILAELGDAAAQDA